MRFLSLILLLALSLFGDTMTPKQLHVLQTVRDVAKSIPDKNGKTYENTVSAICLTESSAGKNTIGDFRHKKSITKASLGPMQIQVATARHVARNVKKLRWLNKLTDIQLAGRLLGDIKLSAQVATYYVILLHEQRADKFNAISGYNGGSVNHPYYARVMKNMDIVNHLVSSGKLS
ncbi:MAG: transglycosylase SLT domain-containing protein [Sulfuricurvum sp.]|uniref:transglycosylase SLT domain-containing protein n=1 Tax=Sulfuricurvum sp. TaxID=2025608 RepID=UPI00260548B8|nr:transglycosylase SLT domain-containing protein [Sulfuricurvum sp.]MDD2368731.1 transglycosylase SLT domain-containing protein [Sulfuricurvum sp.]MDD2951198.1 transglycosylase SLT domain-containing protein [Sulfuricurvum sp.]MDD5119040.1 transglycosylase SLT domain-containing protein [Sulfuricurvum sp.]